MPEFQDIIKRNSSNELVGFWFFYNAHITSYAITSSLNESGFVHSSYDKAPAGKYFHRLHLEPSKTAQTKHKANQDVTPSNSPELRR